MQAGTYFPKVRRMLLCFSPWIFETLSASFHAASRAPCSCHSVSFWDRCSNFAALGLRWWDSLGQINLSEGFWSRILVWRATAFVNFTRWIGFHMFELFRKIVVDFGGSISWNAQPSCRVLDNIATALLSPFFPDLLPGCSYPEMQLMLLQHSYCTFVIILSRPCTRLFINLAICVRALFPKPTTALGLVEQAFWRVPFFTKWVIASSS